MAKQIAIISAADLSGGQWQLGAPMPDQAVKQPNGQVSWTVIENSSIEKMIRVGGYVEVFARTSDGKPIHQTLMPPTISLVFAAAPRAEWEELLNSVSPQAERLDEVLDISGNVWRMNGAFPGDASTTIVAMVSTSQETIDIYILPHPGSELDKQGFAIIITLMPLTVQRTTCKTLSLQQWMSIMHEAQDAADVPDEEDEEVECPSCGAANEPDATFCKECGAPLGEGGEEVVEPEVTPAQAPMPHMPAASAVTSAFAPPPAAATLPNGTGSTTTTTTTAPES
jgi:hypothetical protein